MPFAGDILAWDNARAVGTDAADNVYVLGEYTGTVDFDPGPGVFGLSATGTVDLFLAKYTPAGTFAWAKGIGGGSGQEMRPEDLAVDRAGNTYLIGAFNGSIDFDAGPGTTTLTSGGNDVFAWFVAKYDSNGNFVWVKSPSGRVVIQGVAVDGAGNVLLGGSFISRVDFDPGPGVFHLVSASPFVLDSFAWKLSGAGDFIWARHLSGSAASIAGDHAGDSYVVRQRTNSPRSPETPTPRGILVTKLNVAGAVLWTRSLAGRVFFDSARPRGIALDTANNLYIGGTLQGTIDFDPGPGAFNLTNRSPSHTNAFIVKLTNAGNFAWAQRVGGDAGREVADVTVDRLGRVYLIGEFTGVADFDPSPGTYHLGSHEDAIFVTQLTSGGGFGWARRLDGRGSEQGDGIAVDDRGRVTVAGRFFSADFDPGVGTVRFNSRATWDGFIAQLPEPVTLGHRTLAGNGADRVILRRRGSMLELFDVNRGTAVAAWRWEAVATVRVTGAANEDDTLDVDFTGGSFTVRGGITFSGGSAGTDRLRISGANLSYVVTGTRVAFTGGGSVLLGGVEQVRLAGGAGNNTFTVSAWTGTAVLDGGAGLDRIIASADVDFRLTDTALVRSHAGWLTLQSLEQARLTGGGRANRLDARRFSGPVTLSGGAGDDSLWSGRGNDVLQGGSGCDFVDGGLGRNILDHGPSEGCQLCW
jgi:hypothetical protein